MKKKQFKRLYRDIRKELKRPIGMPFLNLSVSDEFAYCKMVLLLKMGFIDDVDFMIAKKWLRDEERQIEYYGFDRYCEMQRELGFRGRTSIKSIPLKRPEKPIVGRYRLMIVKHNNRPECMHDFKPVGMDIEYLNEKHTELAKAVHLLVLRCSKCGHEERVRRGSKLSIKNK